MMGHVLPHGAGRLFQQWLVDAYCKGTIPWGETHCGAQLDLIAKFRDQDTALPPPVENALS